MKRGRAYLFLWAFAAICLVAALAPFRVGAAEISDYKDLVLYYSDTYSRIEKPTAALVIAMGPYSAGDGGSIQVKKGSTVYFDASGSLPGSAAWIDGIDFQYNKPGTGFVLESSVPASMKLDAAGTWDYYLCVKGNIPSSSIVGGYDDWSANGSHRVLGTKNGALMYWYFVKVSVVVTEPVVTADFMITKDTVNVTGQTVAVTGFPVSLKMTNRSSNATSYAWYQKTSAMPDYALFSTAASPTLAVNTGGTLYIKLIANGVAQAIKTVTLVELQNPVAVISAPSSATIGQAITLSGTNSYSPNAGGYITGYEWQLAGSESNMSIYSESGQISYLAAGTYTVRITVTDNTGRKSAQAAWEITVSAPATPAPPPVLSIEPAGSDWTNKPVTFTVSTGGSPQPGTILRYTVSRNVDMPDAGAVYVTSEPGAASLSGQLNEDGMWYVYAGAAYGSGSDSGLLSAGPFCMDFTVPYLGFSKQSGTAVFRLDVTVSCSDGLSGVTSLKTAWALSQTKPQVWDETTDLQVTRSIAREGTYWLHAEAADRAGNVKYRCYGPFVITGPTPAVTGISLSGSWGYWPDQPYRFMGLETVYLRVTTSGYADRVVIRLSPELEAMTFSDGKGNRYDYAADFFGRQVLFPLGGTCLLDPQNELGQADWSYALPIAPDTLDPETGARIGTAYKIYVTVYSGTKYATYMIDGIDITGTVLDRIWLQPKTGLPRTSLR